MNKNKNSFQKSEPSDRKSRIMIVEDESITAMGLKSNLEDMEYVVTCICESGNEAIENARKDMPDLILMDITLRGKMNGIEAAHKIHSLFRIPIVYLTAHSAVKIIEEAKSIELFGYIIKPFDNQELKTAIKVALDEKHEWPIANTD